MASNDDFFGFVRYFIHGSGLGPKSSKIRRFISLWILLPTSLCLDALVVYDFLYVSDDILKVAELLESVASFGQVQKILFNLIKPTFL